MHGRVFGDFNDSQVLTNERLWTLTLVHTDTNQGFMGSYDQHLYSSHALNIELDEESMDASSIPVFTKLRHYIFLTEQSIMEVSSQEGVTCLFQLLLG